MVLTGVVIREAEEEENTCKSVYTRMHISTKDTPKRQDQRRKNSLRRTAAPPFFFVYFFSFSFRSLP
jgi:hypothetical protein